VSCVLADRLGVESQDDQGRVLFRQRDAQGNVPTDPTFGGGYAVYDVAYRTVQFDVKADDEITTEMERYLIRRPKYALENLTIPSQSFQWGAAGETGNPAGDAIPNDGNLPGSAIAGDTTKPFPTVALTYSWVQVPKLPSATILAHLGKVNAAAFDASYGNYPAETLLFLSVEPTPVVHGTGQVYWDLNFQLLYRPTGWNKLFKPGSSYGTFYKVVNRNTGEPSIYDTFTMTDLFDASKY